MHFSPSLIFNYLRECYELDTKTINVTNFFAQKVEDKIWVEGTDEVLNGSLPYLPLLDEQAEKIEENLSFYSKEKSLYAFAHFLVGKAGGNRVCAPLIFIPAEIYRRDEYPYLRLLQDQKFLNYNFLNTIKKEGTPPLDELFRFLLESPVIDFGVSARMARVLEENFDVTSADGMLQFPELIAEKKIKAKRPKEHFEAYAGMGIGLVRYSSKTLGIISELNDLSNKTELSGALNALFTNSSASHEAGKDSRVPSILSDGQKKVLENSLKYAKSIVIGPPGTGKSFTIANVAIDHVLQEKSVLIVSKTDEAVDVVLDKLDELGMRSAAMRPGKRSYAREIRKRIKVMLMQTYKEGFEHRTTKSRQAAWRLGKELGELEKQFHAVVENELKWGNLLYKSRDNQGIIAKLKKRYIKWKQKSVVPNWEIAANYYEKKNSLLKNHQQLALFGYEEQLNCFLRSHRKHLSGFLEAINAFSLTKQEKLFKTLDFSQILKTFPIWLCKLSDLNEGLPLQKDLFDLVVVDEASQVDLASIMPALYRAKKLLVVGDPNQLRHFSFVSGAQQKGIQRKLGIDGLKSELLAYRDKSILDICFEQSLSNDEVVFLDEHFRGNEQLLSFSNHEFYGGQLKIMKSLPVHKYQSVWIEQCGGERSTAGINEVEIDRIFQAIRDIRATRYMTETPTTIGVLSPYRNQMERIIERMQLELGADVINEHKIMVGTPYLFQGNERDVIIISWCMDEQTHPSAIRYLDHPQVFNVTVTRAKRKVINLISFNPNFLNPDMLLKRYLNQKSALSTEEVLAKSVHDQFLEEVGKWLKEIECTYLSDYEVASIPVDILITSSSKNIAIDLIGFPGKFVDSIELDQYMLLQRAGVSVFPLPYSFWYLNNEFAKKEFIEFLHKTD